MAEWRKLPLSLAELCIDTTLRCGQSFRWRKINGNWHCALHGRLVSLKQDSTHLHYRVATKPTSADSISEVPISCPLPSASPSTPIKPAVSQPSTTSATDEAKGEIDDTAALLHHYLNLTPSLASLYKAWSAADPVFAARAPHFAGVRILNQDSWEALVSFICSSNNNITRISVMVQRLCENWGPYLGSMGGEDFHDFPSPSCLAADERLEEKLKALGFGYRARYIAETAAVLAERGMEWLDGLRNPASPVWPRTALSSVPALSVTPEIADDKKPPSYRTAHADLLTLSGVGPKVADCVCLMGLGWLEAVPMDTHVWQIAQRDYGFRGSGGAKTFNKTLYDTVGNHFRSLWGDQAGWAHSILFTADLKAFASQAAGASNRARAGSGVEEEDGAGDGDAVSNTLGRGAIASPSTIAAANGKTEAEIRRINQARQELDGLATTRKRSREADDLLDDLLDEYKTSSLFSGPRTFRRLRKRRRP